MSDGINTDSREATFDQVVTAVRAHQPWAKQKYRTVRRDIPACLQLATYQLGLAMVSRSNGNCPASAYQITLAISLLIDVLERQGIPAAPDIANIDPAAPSA